MTRTCVSTATSCTASRQLIHDRKVHPQDPDIDPISSLLAVRIDGEALPDAMILGALRQFLMVGIVAPTTFIGSAVVHLARNPDKHHTLLKNDPSLIPDAVEELLRLYTPYRGFARTARCDVRFGDKLVREGDVVAAVFTSGNRDEDVFNNPDEFDLNRRKQTLLTFGVAPTRVRGPRSRSIAARCRDRGYRPAHPANRDRRRDDHDELARVWAVGCTD